MATPTNDKNYKIKCISPNIGMITTALDSLALNYAWREFLKLLNKNQ